MKVSVLFSVAAALALAACSKPMAVKADFNGDQILQCDAAAVTKLQPESGGFRFNCPGNSSLYVIYDTAEAKDGSVRMVDIALPGAKSQSYLPAVHSSVRGNEDCPSAKALQRKTGESPFPTDLFGNPKHGKYEFAMAKPCGTLTVTLGGK